MHRRLFPAPKENQLYIIKLSRASRSAKWTDQQRPCQLVLSALFCALNATSVDDEKCDIIVEVMPFIGGCQNHCYHNNFSSVFVINRFVTGGDTR